MWLALGDRYVLVLLTVGSGWGWEVRTIVKVRKEAMKRSLLWLDFGSWGSEKSLERGPMSSEPGELGARAGPALQAV